MTVEVPTVEPSELVVGDTWSWKRSLADYPANASPAWVLTYYFRGQAGEFSVACSADGSDQLAAVAKATTATYKPGLYSWIAVVTDGTTRTTLGRGITNLKPDPAATGAGLDPRSHARKTLDAVEAVIENRATKDQQAYTIGGRSLQRMKVEELLMLRDRYRAEVAAEDVSERLANGKPGGQRLLARL